MEKRRNVRSGGEKGDKKYHMKIKKKKGRIEEENEKRSKRGNVDEQLEAKDEVKRSGVNDKGGLDRSENSSLLFSSLLYMLLPLGAEDIRETLRFTSVS
jgi:hypothetical protein